MVNMAFVRFVLELAFYHVDSLADVPLDVVDAVVGLFETRVGLHEV